MAKRSALDGRSPVPFAIKIAAADANSIRAGGLYENKVRIISVNIQPRCCLNAKAALNLVRTRPVDLGKCAILALSEIVDAASTPIEQSHRQANLHELQSLSIALARWHRPTWSDARLDASSYRRRYRAEIRASPEYRTMMHAKLVQGTNAIN